MLTLRPSQVPEYLRTSSFFLGLNVVDDDEFSIPVNHMKFDTNVRSLNDMTELLNTIRFWGLDIIPQAMVDFAARQLTTEIESILEPYRADLPLFTTVCSIVAEVADCKARVERAMESGNLEVVQYFHKKGVPFTDRAIALAAGKGALDCLQYTLGDVTTDSPDNYVFSEAVRNGCMDSIIFLRQKGFPLQHHHGWVHGVGLPAIAASSGQCDMLKYLHSQGCPFHSAAIAAADAGHIDCLDYAIRNGAFLRGECPYASKPRISLAQRLARANQLKLFPLVLSRESRTDAQTALSLVNSGDCKFWKRCFKYNARHCIYFIAAVAQKGHLTCLQYLYQLFADKDNVNGKGSNWITYAANLSNDDSLKPADIAQLTADAEQWECLQFLITHGCPMNNALTTSLAQAGRLELYYLATAHGCKVSVQAACTFAEEGDLELLHHALEHRCEQSEEILRAAARHGQLQCLIYAHAQGCPWSTQVTLAAARDGHLECLQYLHEHGCPWSAQVTLAAARGGHQECLQYLHEHGCPWDARMRLRSAVHKQCLPG